MVDFKKAVLIITVIGLLFYMPLSGYCQNNNTAEIPLMLSIPPVSLINFAVDGEQVITYSYSFLEPNNVEQIINPNTGDNTWLNYSSIVNPGATNYITANISSGSLPADVTLRVIISEDAGFGSGATGTPIGEITLSSYPQNIIVNIGSCYTGAGTNRGHRLTYIWDNPESYNYSNNYENGQAIAITYTITSTE
ncbi:MAG: hypothetical protein CVT99_15580 [Bacteroidetes bacterium HGW-Bacteroidetes-16]|nr:MAG: hypothetical protein CVT99_15580 [Bacteroidetes bacterium HGW-Bacteroidetes-16]